MFLNSKQFLMKFDRVCAWGLIVIMAAFFISGYGETKGIIPAQIAKFLHETLLPLPGVIAFAFHSAYGMHISFKRWKIWGPVPKTILIIYGLALVIGLIIIEYIIGVPNNKVRIEL